MIIHGIAKLKDEGGMTLVELLIVLAIITILAVTLGFEFSGWVGNYKVESQIKQIHADLMYARARAMEKNRIHFFIPSSASYTIYEDDSDGSAKVPDGDGNLQTGSGAGSDTQLTGFPKTVQYALTWDRTGNVKFDRTGLVSPSGTISVPHDSSMNPDYDCIVLDQTRINMGQLNGANCLAK